MGRTLLSFHHLPAWFSSHGCVRYYDLRLAIIPITWFYIPCMFFFRACLLDWVDCQVISHAFLLVQRPLCSVTVTVTRHLKHTLTNFHSGLAFQQQPSAPAFTASNLGPFQSGSLTTLAMGGLGTSTFSGPLSSGEHNTPYSGTVSPPGAGRPNQNGAGGANGSNGSFDNGPFSHQLP
jgi:hypothetical protein